MVRELIYVYVENLNECFINQGFNFSSNFEVDFNIHIGDLSINQKRCTVSDYFKNNKIKSINLIVGKNGSGKSTILDLLGSDNINRIDLMANSKTKRWFAVYHVKKDHYVIEGNDIRILKNIDNAFRGISDDYAIVIKKEGVILKCVEFIQDFDNERGKLLYLYNVTNPGEYWYSSKVITDGFDAQLGYQRRYLTTPLMKDVYKVLNESVKKIDNKFAGRNVILRISKRDLTSDMINLELKNSLDLKFNLYNGKVDVLLMNPDLDFSLIEMENMTIEQWSVKERFIIEFLEESILYRIIDNKKSLTNDDFKKINKINYPSNRDTYKARIYYLKEILDVLDSNEKINYFDSFKQNDHNYGKIISLLENIDENYYSKNIIVDHIFDSRDKNDILELIEFFDKTNEIRERFPLRIEFSNLSSGELQFIKHYSNLSKALNIDDLNKKIENIIILLDEPDTNFHPEWSRRYIDNLIELLNSNNLESEIQFQIIITTHSPFMISDIPKQYITCIDVIEENGIMNRVVSKSDFGLMSNFYDLIKNNFFMEQPIGAYASKFFNEIISDINKLNSQHSTEEFCNIEKKIELIDDQIIKSKLLSYFNKKTLGLLSDEEKLKRKRERLISELEKVEKELENDQFKG